MRNFAPQQVAPDEGQELHATASACVTSDALVEVQRALGALRGVRIVRHHDDRLAVLAVERLQQVEDLVAGLAIEVAGRLVAQQQRRIGDDRAGDADALLLAAGELARVVLRAVAEADDVERGRRRACVRSRLRQLGQQQRQLDVLARGQHRQQVVELEDEADVPRAPARRAAPSDSSSMSVAADRRSCPSVGRSRPPIRLSSVVLPEPDGPISARNSPCGHVEVDALQHVDALAAAREVPCARRGS